MWRILFFSFVFVGQAVAGDWKQSPNDPAAFTAGFFKGGCSNGTWTGIGPQRYKIVDQNQMLVLFHLEATSVSGCSPMMLFWQLPEKYVTSAEFLAPVVYWQDDVGFASALVQSYETGQDKVAFMRFSGNWSLSVNRTYLWGQFNVPVVKASP